MSNRSNAVSPSTLQECPQCGEWVQRTRLADHRLWAHNVGGAVGIEYFDSSSPERLRHYLNQMEGTSV